MKRLSLIWHHMIKNLRLHGYNYSFEDERTIAVEVERDQGVNGIFEQFSQQGVKVLSMRNKSNRLEEFS